MINNNTEPIIGETDAYNEFLKHKEQKVGEEYKEELSRGLELRTIIKVKFSKFEMFTFCFNPVLFYSLILLLEIEF